MTEKRGAYTTRHDSELTCAVVLDMVVKRGRQRNRPACRHGSSARRSSKLRSAADHHRILFHLLLGSAAEPEMRAEESGQDACVDRHRFLQSAKNNMTIVVLRCCQSEGVSNLLSYLRQYVSYEQFKWQLKTFPFDMSTPPA